MCRIAGIVDSLRYQDQLKEDVDLMITKMIHGGPDGRGLFIEKTISLGHCRLSLLDLSSAGAQPMRSDDEKLHISYNGEIYNFHDIKKELISLGHQFKTVSDTEVILHAYREWGVSSFSRFNGMFAFALYDTTLQKIFLVRDPNGIKPLYFSTINNQLIFASELKAFQSFVGEENPAWRTLFLAYGHLPEPFTKLKDVFSLAKSSYLEYNIINKTYSISKFKYKSDRAFENASIYDIAFELSNSVRRHLISDAPIGLFLSGGIDSSILTLLASKQTAQLHTLSIYFNEGEYSEKHYQDIIVQLTKSDHHALLLTKEDFLTNVSTIQDAYDMPSNDGVNTWFISKYARENGLKAVLSGLGADEIFGGYPSFTRLAQLKYAHQFKSIINKFSGLLPGNLERLSFLKLDSAVSDYLLLRGFYAPNKIAAILNLQVTEVLEQLNTYVPSTARKLNTVTDISLMEKEMYMQNQLLKDSDYMSMRHGIEIRVPFLDNDFLSLVDSMNEADVFPHPGKKEVLINAFTDILPKEIYNRPKKGFQFPFKMWLKESEYIKSQMNTSEKEIEYNAFTSDKIHWSKIWALTQI
jgi:asparagine synthase (glutamine-hydrolysing)